MNRPRKFWQQVKMLFQRERFHRELDEEMLLHRELRAREHREAGATPDEARITAQQRFGNALLLREESREMWGMNLLKDFAQDMRFGLRTLKKNLGFTAVAVLTLAIGIGANTAIFSVIHAVLLKPLVMAEPSRVMFVQETWRDILPNGSAGNFTELQRRSNSFEKIAASNNASFNLAAGDAPQRVQGEIATADYFATFQVQPITGRVYTAEEDKPGHGKVVVISEGLWRARLQADPTIVGQPLKINGEPYTVLGVMPRTFDPLLQKSELWIPSAFTAAQIADYDDHYLNVVGRLKSGVTPGLAQAELNVLASRLQQEHPIDNKDRGFRVTPLTTALLGDQRLALWMMLAAVGFVLMIACANIANLQLARARGRRKEISLRAALGATPRRIIRQLLTENILLGLASGGAGILLAYWGVAWIVASGPAGVPRLEQSSVDASTIGFACGVTLLCSFLFGLAPALRSASPRLSETFKQATGTTFGSRDKTRSVLVAGQVGLALVLMTGAGLLIRSALIVSHIDSGFDTTNLFVGRVGLPEAGYRDPKVARQTFERVITATAALPGVQSAAVVSRAPMAGGGGTNGLLPEGKAFDMSNVVNANLQIISVNYLSTARIPLKAGREFLAQDTRDSIFVTIINEKLARTMWPGENAIGKRFSCCEAGPGGRDEPVYHEVVGVVGDVRAAGLDHEVQPEFYLPMAQMPPSSWDWIGRTMDIVVRMRGGALPANDLRTIVDSIAPGVPVYRLSTIQEKISGRLEESHFDTFLLAIFAMTALLLSSVGIYGVLSYTVTQRTREIGIRMAIGATQRQVMRGVLWDGARLAGLGLALGLVGSLIGTRMLSTMLYGVQPTDAITFVLASLALAVVALFASYVPALRATKVDPTVALRYE